MTIAAITLQVLTLVVLLRIAYLLDPKRKMIHIRGIGEPKVQELVELAKQEAGRR